MSVLTEVCVDSIDGVRVAAAAGADRIELCCALEVGGLTPSIALIEQAVEVAAASLRVPGPLRVHVLIRPRPGDFVYSDDEIRCMEKDIAAAVAGGVDGVVIGALDPDGAVDQPTTARLVSAAREAADAAGRVPQAPALTFHRAFDVAADPVAALESVRRNGIGRILTSGQAATAPAGTQLLAELVRRSADETTPVTILAGGGVRPENVAELVRASGVTEVHFSGRGTVGSPMRYRHPAVTMGSRGFDEYTRGVTDPELVRATIAAAGA